MTSQPKRARAVTTLRRVEMPPTLPDGDIWLIPAPEVARRLNVSLNAVYDMLNRGDLQGKRVGRLRMVRAESLAEWLAS